VRDGSNSKIVIPAKAAIHQLLPQQFHRLMRRWIALCIPTFSLVFPIQVLMVTRADVATPFSLGASRH
jgi:uncharacterized membrane protein